MCSCQLHQIHLIYYNNMKYFNIDVCQINIVVHSLINNITLNSLILCGVMFGLR